MHVSESRKQILPDPRVIHIPDTMFLAYLSNLGSNVWIPGTAHTREEVVLNLKVESPSKIARNGASIGRRGFDLRLEPTNRFASCLVFQGRIAVGIDKVVRQREEKAQGKTLADSHEHDDSQGGPAESIVSEWGVNIQVNVRRSQCHGILPPFDDVVILHLDANILRPALTKIHHLGIEYSGEPIETEHEDEVSSLKFVPPKARDECQMRDGRRGVPQLGVIPDIRKVNSPLPFRVADGIIVKCEHWL